MKTDFYTKTVLTIIAIFLGIIVFRNVDFITAAQANVTTIATPTPKKEKIENDNNQEITLFIYENSKITRPFSNEGGDFIPERHVCRIGVKDIPSHIITNIKPKDGWTDYVEIEKSIR